MTNVEHPKPDSLTYEELLQQNRSLRRELEEFRAQELMIWNLFAETSRKFQVYSASIKAAVSSLLDPDIFWDTYNQHEFLLTIDSSVNQVAEIAVLLTLAFRAKANRLVLSSDFHLLQEILSASQARALRKMPGMKLEISFPPEGKPVFVDYEYLNIALLLLYEVLFSASPANRVRVAVTEMEGAWILDIWGVNSSIVGMIEQMSRHTIQPESNEVLTAENVLRLHVVCEILRIQQISVGVYQEPEQLPILRLTIPDITAM